MTSADRQINIIYQAHKKGPVKHYDGPEGKVWISRKRSETMPNIVMSWHAEREPEKGDSMYVIEPICVSPKDYDISYLRKFKHIFTWATRAFDGTPVVKKVVPINHPSCKNPPSIESVKNRKPWSERRNEIVFVANNKTSSHRSELYRMRLQLADWLNKHSKFKVSWYGQFGPDRHYYRGTINNKLELLNQVKFSICTENCYDPKYSANYFTEKMPHVWFGGAVPIYMGCHNIDRFKFGPNSYIDLRGMVTITGKRKRVDFKALDRRLNAFAQADYDAYRADVLANLEKPNGLYHVISSDRVHARMLNTIFGDPNPPK